MYMQFLSYEYLGIAAKCLIANADEVDHFEGEFADSGKVYPLRG